MACAGRQTSCRACPLWRDATQVVFGGWAGQLSGDADRRGGRATGRTGPGGPFVGPGGRAASTTRWGRLGLDQYKLYVTNAVKHFKFERRGKRRIHQTPSKLEVEACRPWLEAELNHGHARNPSACSGRRRPRRSSAQAFKVTKQRGELLERRASPTTRSPPSTRRRSCEDRPKQRKRSFGALVEDLRVLAAAR